MVNRKQKAKGSCIWTGMGETCKPENTTPSVKYRSGSMVFGGRFAARGTGVLLKTAGILWKKHHAIKLKQHLKTTPRKSPAYTMTLSTMPN